MTALCRVDAAREISCRQGPILIPDTCSLLDIIRAPVRPQFGEGDGAVLAKLLARTGAETPDATLVLTSQVLHELDANLEQVTEETRRDLEKASDTIRSILDRMGWLGDPTRHVAIQLHQVGHPDIGRDLLARLLAYGVEIADDDDAVMAAGRRAGRDVAPARKGKQSYKDCLVIETALRFTAACRRSGIQAPIIFLSANTTDYCVGRTLRLRPPLDEQFAEVGLDFQPRWAAVYRQLR